MKETLKLNHNEAHELHFNPENYDVINQNLNFCTTWYFEENEFISSTVLGNIDMHCQDNFKIDFKRIGFNAQSKSTSKDRSHILNYVILKECYRVMIKQDNVTIISYPNIKPLEKSL